MTNAVKAIYLRMLSLTKHFGYEKKSYTFNSASEGLEFTEIMAKTHVKKENK